MRGISERQKPMPTIFDLEDRIAQDHPIRRIKALGDGELKKISKVLDEMYSHTGRPSIPPERILKSMLLMAFCWAPKNLVLRARSEINGSARINQPE
jgi:transposase